MSGWWCCFKAREALVQANQEPTHICVSSTVLSGVVMFVQTLTLNCEIEDSGKYQL